MGVVKYTGPVASFHCPTNAEIRSLKVHFSPKQEGTGDPSPENVRPIVGWDGVEVEKKGKNLYKVQHRTSAKANYTETNSGLIVSSTSDGTYCGSHFKLLSVTSKNIGQTFTFSAKCISATQAQRILLTIRNSDNSHFRTVFEKTSDYVYTFTVPNDFPKDGYYQIGYYCTGAVSTSGTTEYSEIQLELGSKATSYEPYHDEMVDYEFGVLGKNKVPFLVNSKTISTQTNGNAGWCNVWKIPNKNLKYTYSAYIDNTNNTVAANVTVWFKNIDNTSYVDGTAKSGTQVAAGAVGRSTITLDASILNNTYYFLFGITSFIKSGETVSCTFSNPMVEIGDTATTYEPYDPKNTVYGGWVDLISGEVCEEWISCNFTSNVKLSASWYSTDINRDTIGVYRNAAVWNNTPYPVPIASGCMFDYCKIGAVYSENTPWVARFLFTSNSFNRFEMRLPKSVLADVSTEEATYQSVKDYLDAHPLQAVYQIAPIHYQLAPTQLQTFLGQNNVWSNADYVEVEYDLHETQEILNRKAFIMANQPHLVVPEAAQLQSFTTDLAAPLKECKAYFKPKQDFNGYDRPWPAGGGKNLFNINASYMEPSDTNSINTTLRIFQPNTYDVGMAYNNYRSPTNIKNYLIENNAITITGSSGYGVSFAFSLNPGNYILNYTAEGEGVNVGRSFYDDTGTLISGTSISTPPYVLTVPENASITLITFGSRGTSTTNTYSNIQLEAGSTATSYEPYENICPIEGWDELIITQVGANILNKNLLIDGGYISGNNTITPVSWYKYTDYIPCKPGIVWLWNTTVSSSTLRHICFFDINKTLINSFIQMEDDIAQSYIAPDNTCWMRLNISPSLVDIAMVSFLQPINYNPYTFISHSFNFPSKIYGGYVDLVNGVLVMDKKFVKLNGTENWLSNSAVLNGYYYTAGDSKSTSFYLMSDKYTSTQVPGGQMVAGQMKKVSTNINFCTSFDSLQAWKNELAANNVELVYELFTPITYQLTPQEIRTLRGTNNIWSNSNGNITVQFWRH